MLIRKKLVTRNMYMSKFALTYILIYNFMSLVTFYQMNFIILVKKLRKWKQNFHKNYAAENETQIIVVIFMQYL